MNAGPVELSLADAPATEALGAGIAEWLHAAPGAVVYLIGELGAGKTTLARGLLRALGVQGAVRSPTYTLLEPYEIQGRSVLHMDLYRLQDPDELITLGAHDYSPRSTVWLVEWPERGHGQLPAAQLTVELWVTDETRGARLRLAPGLEPQYEALRNALLQHGLEADTVETS
jgi:tRNA threonylcarbamoyladenosine biosynthesis protein TsaE